MYEAIKHTHMLCALLSITGFVLRSSWAFQGSRLLKHKITRTLPHLIDTVFLLSAFTLSLMLQQYPFFHTWLTAKFFGLVAYIIFGSYTLKGARNNRQRVVFFILAVATFGYVVSVARSHDALGLLHYF